MIRKSEDSKFMVPYCGAEELKIELIKDIINAILLDWQVFSFKLRGAYNMMAKLSKKQLERGVICSSAGNHAQGVALSAQRLGCNAVIAMPVTTPEIKVLLPESHVYIFIMVFHRCSEVFCYILIVEIS